MTPRRRRQHQHPHESTTAQQHFADPAGTSLFARWTQAWKQDTVYLQLDPAGFSASDTLSQYRLAAVGVSTPFPAALYDVLKLVSLQGYCLCVEEDIETILTFLNEQHEHKENP